VQPGLRAALNAAGVPAEAAVRQAASVGNASIVVVQSSNLVALSIFNKSTGRATTVTGAPQQVTANVGTWAAASDAEGSTLAVLVPDGVTDVRFSDARGETTHVTPRNDVAVLRSSAPQTAAYGFGGTTHLAGGSVP